MIQHSDNPFLSRAKSNDLKHEEIKDLWIQYEGDPKHPGFDARSPMATVVLGGKGSGKTHLFRYFSFPVQGLRYGCSDWTEGLRTDGYLGIYSRADGLNGSRFANKGVDPEAWREVFRQYMELWLADGFLRTLISLVDHVADIDKCQAKVVSEFWRCLDIRPRRCPHTLSEFHAHLVDCRHRLDVAVNEAAFDRTIQPDLVCTAGSLIFGLPRLLVQHVPSMGDMLISYYIDECENLLSYQQRYVNTLVRERSAPTTFRIGARSYGMRTFATDSGDGEEIRDGSEFNLLQLDAHYRKVQKSYRKFAKQLLERRIEAVAESSTFRASADISDWFAPREKMLKESHHEDHHIEKLRKQLARTGQSLFVTEKLRCTEDVILEKAAIFRFYQHVAKGNDNFADIASEICLEIKEALAGEKNKISSIVEHYSSDFAAQISEHRRQRRQIDCSGLGDFITISEGLPRELLNVVGNVLSSASFRGETPIAKSSISIDSQRLGILDSAKRFYSNIPMAGKNGDLIHRSIFRLGELFRLNRFADKPIECSLIGFSVRLEALSPRAQEVIEEAEQRSFLLRGIQNDRSTKQIWDKFYLNRLLCPIFDLGIAIRGLYRFPTPMADAIFGDLEDAPYERVRREWKKRLMWPFDRDEIFVTQEDIFET